MTNTHTTPGMAKSANLAASAKEKLGKQVTHIIENLPTGLEMTMKIARGKASVSLGFDEAVEVPYSDLLAGDTLYEGLSETLTMLMNFVSGAPSLIVDTKHATNTPAAAIQMLEQLLQGSNKQADVQSIEHVQTTQL